MTTSPNPDAVRHWRGRRRQAFRAAFQPRPRLTGTAWAEACRELKPPKPEPGEFRMSRTPYFREVLDAVTGSDEREVVVKKSARVGFTEGVLENAIAYHILQDPCSILVVQPTDSDAEDWSKENIDGLIGEIPDLASRISDSRARDPDSTIRVKSFPGGRLRVTGATSPRNARRFHVRKIFFDETSGYPREIGKEGSTLGVFKRRAQNAWNRQYVYGSTPVEAGACAITELFDLSDKRYFFVACPHCAHRQTLKWGGPDQPYGIKYETYTLAGNKIVVPGSVVYECENCHCGIEGRHKERMVQGGEWRATNAGAAIRGYHISALYSLFDGARWEVLVQEWLDAQGKPLALKAFVNTVLGETWEHPGGRITVSALQERAEDWRDAAGRRIEVPHGVGLITAFVDLQERNGNYMELLVKGWGAREESWNLLHQRIYGPIDQPWVWAQLEAFRTRIWRHASGAPLRIAAMGIDSGWARNEVYRYVGPKQKGRFRVFATKGADTDQREPFRMSKTPNESGVQLVLIGTVPMKDDIFPRLMLKAHDGQLEAGGSPWGYIHFRAKDDPDWPPEDRWHNGMDEEYYRQFDAEVRVPENGRFVYRNPKRLPNEAIDLEVGNLAVLHILLPTATRETTLASYASHLSAWRPKESRPDAQPTAVPRGRGRVLSRGASL